VTDEYFSLSPQDRADALNLAADRSGRPAELLEKDVWVVSVLKALFNSPPGAHLTFKGGTSLSKAYGLISRFSEDVDITYDIRQLLPQETRNGVIPASRSQAEKWTAEAKGRLRSWVAKEAVPAIGSGLEYLGAKASVVSDDEIVEVTYEPATQANALGYVRPRVLVEFGGRSTGEPRETKAVICDAALHVPTVSFPAASPWVMRPERTFWEKATAAHAYAESGKLRGERFARHHHDLIMLAQSPVATGAINDRALANEVATHKARFFRETDSSGKVVDYVAAVRGNLRLVPSGDALWELEQDYKRMTEAGLLEAGAIGFEGLMANCQELADRVNGISP
jgi:hypothetical protein